MKAFILKQYLLLKEEKIIRDSVKVLGWFFSLIISIYLLISLAIPLYQTSNHKGFVFPTDNDGGRAIEVSMDTKWYNSNHFAAYGNLYYRLSHTLADLIRLKTDGLSQAENREKAHNFSLKLVSLLSLFSLGLFFGWIFFGLENITPLYASLFTVLTLQMPMWSEWVFRPHPEHLLNVFTAIAVYFFAKLLLNKENRRTFILSAFFWGLAMAVKRSTSIFIPGILVMLLLPWRKDSFRTVISYIGYMLLAYLLVGFPQNFGFYKHIKFLLYESSLHSLGDAESIGMNLKLIWSQLVYLVPIVVLSSLFSRNKEKNFSWKILVFVLISFVPILMRKMSFSGNHHTMALAVALMVVALIFSLHLIPWRFKSNILVFVISIATMKLTGVSDSYIKMKNIQTTCFREYEKIEEYLQDKISENKLLVKETFFPAKEVFYPFTKNLWGVHWEEISPKVGYLGLTNANMIDYLSDPPTYFYGKRLLDYDKKRRFYKDFHGKDSVTSPTGVTFKKIFSGVSCDLELWEKVDQE